MPRCYMVKKQGNKYPTIKDYWSESRSAPGAPDSPIEACVAPSYYATSPIQTGYHHDYYPNGPSSPDLEVERASLFRERSAEETEAAHDLLSLSQSLPPLPAPSTVTIHHILPHGETPPSPVLSYRPLTPDETLPAYQQHNIVYVVQVPPPPTPPASEYSSDSEMQSLQIHQTAYNSDIIILPLSPEPIEENYIQRAATSVIVAPRSKPKPPPIVPVREKSVITSTRAAYLNMAERRQRKDDGNNNNVGDDNNRSSKNTGVGGKKTVNNKETKMKYFKMVTRDDIEIISKKDASNNIKKPSRYTCKDCGKHYATSSNLSRHRQTHRSLDSKAAKKCLTCGKIYVSMPALAMHLLTHKLDHRCGICRKFFSRPWLLQGHLRSHTGEKPYGCAHCGKAFADRSNLRAHMQTHSSNKNYSCNKCKKTFALKSYLNKHHESACWDTNETPSDEDEAVLRNLRAIMKRD